MRFAHLSDSHLGKRQLGIFQREEDYYEVFERTIDKIIELDVDFVIHSGDVFESSRPSTNALLAFQKGLLRLNEADIPVYAIAGNHDTVLRKNVMPPIVLFEELGLNIIRPDCAFVEDDTLICGVQYVPSSQKNALTTILSRLSEKAEEYEKSILVLHQGLGKFLPEGAAEIELADLPDNFNYYAMGHLHDYIEEDIYGGKLIYPGSMELDRLNENFEIFGRGFCVVDLTDGKPEVERIEIAPARSQMIEKIEFSNFKEELEELKKRIMDLDEKPMLDLMIYGGDFESSDIYDIIVDEIGDHVLNLRPEFKPDKVLEEERKIIENKPLDPRAVLRAKVDEKYRTPEVTDLSVDLLDNLAYNKTDDAKVLSENFYSEHYAPEDEQ